MGKTQVDAMISNADKQVARARQEVGHCTHRTRRRRVTLIAVVLTSCVTAYPAEEGAQVHNPERAATGLDNAQTTNVFCPVLPNMKANPDIYTDYQGKRVYFCCVDCRATFEKNPEKYLALLPQFGAAAPEATHGHGTTLAELIEPAGIATFSCLALTVGMGLLRRKRPRLLLKWHKRLGVATLVLALIHLTLVLVAH